MESPGEFAGLFRRRIAWDDGAIWEAVGVGAVAVLMNRCCRSGEDVFGGNAVEAQHNEKEVEKLHAKIGRLAMENDFLSKVLGRDR